MWAKAVSLLVGGLVLPSQEPAEKEITTAVFGAIRAGFVKHDFNAYQSIWTDDARMICGRRDQGGKYRFTLTRLQIDDTRRLRFKAKPTPGLTITFTNPVVEVKGDRATLSVTTVSTYPQGRVSMAETVGETYRLRKTAGGWKVYENEWWPVKITMGRDTFFEEGKTSGLDARVEEERKNAGDSIELVGAYAGAYRLVEAYETAKRVTDSREADAALWSYRAHMALVVGYAADGEQSYRKAYELDPTADVPDYAKIPKDQ